MIITTINNNKLFIQFDRLVTKGMIHITDNKNFKSDQKIRNSDFEIMDLPESINKVHIHIVADKTKIFKTINLNN